MSQMSDVFVSGEVRRLMKEAEFQRWIENQYRKYQEPYQHRPWEKEQGKGMFVNVQTEYVEGVERRFVDLIDGDRIKMSIDDATAAEWDRVTKASQDKQEQWKNGWGDVVKVDVDALKTDSVNKPDHYNNGSIEAIDYIKQQLGEGFRDYCEGNVLKYLHRYRYKNGVEDLRKARWYLERLIKEEVN